VAYFSHISGCVNVNLQ